MKQCTRCKIPKTIAEFSKMDKSVDGRQPRCKACASIAGKVYRRASREKIAAYSAKWSKANPGKVKASVAKWSKANKEKIAAYSSAYYAANKEKRDAYRAANLDVWRTYYHNRRARKLANGGKLSPGLSAKLFTLQRGKCACCGKPLGKTYHLDHIMPLALGGANEDRNIQLLRAKCNNEKHANHPVDFMRSRGFLL